MSQSDKSDRQLLLEIHTNLAVLTSQVTHHVGPTCARHEADMQKMGVEIKETQQDVADLRVETHGNWRQAIGLAVALPVILALVVYIWNTHLSNEQKALQSHYSQKATP